MQGGAWEGVGRFLDGSQGYPVDLDALLGSSHVALGKSLGCPG